MGMRRAWLAGAAALAVWAAGLAPASGQTLPDYVPRGNIDPVQAAICIANPTSKQCVLGGAAALSSEDAVVLNAPKTDSRTSTVFSTQVIGRIAGGTPLYDQTFASPFASPTVQAGLVSARAAVTTAGGPGVIIGAPVLTASRTTTAISSTTRYSLVGTSIDARSETTIAPGSTLIGARITCNVTSALQNNTAPVCTTVTPVAAFNFRLFKPGQERTINYSIQNNVATNIDTTPVQVNLLNLDGALALTNSIITTTYTIDQTVTTTQTTTVFEQYTLSGVVRRIGTVHALAADAGGEAAGLFTTRLRLAADGPLRRGFWLTGYGFFGQRKAQGEIAADRRTGEGLTGGFVASLGNGWSAGAGFDAGRTRLQLPLVGESGRVELAQAGAHLGLDRAALSLRLSAAYGWGHVETVTAPADIPATTGARYGLRTASVSGEAGYAVALGAWRLTPVAGGEWRRISTDRFVEPGTFGLAAAAHDTDETRGWAGLTLARPVGASGGLRLYGRATVQGHDRVILPVSFAVLGGGVMRLESPDYGTLGAEAGASAILPLGPNAQVYAAYDARVRGNLALHTASGGLRMTF